MLDQGDHQQQPGAVPLTIWRLTDDKAGHDKQSLGLANALGRLRETRLHNIHLPQPGSGLAAWLIGWFEPGHHLPSPDLILGAGHLTHVPMLAARRAFGGRIVVLMKPSLPLGLFDLCLIPKHDRPTDRPNVIATQGALNTVVPSLNHDPARGLILIGGPSQHFHWANGRVAEQIREIVARDSKVAWTLTTSRRTPMNFLPRLADLAAITLLPHDQTPNGWLEAELGASGQVWATPDSVSMIYEALTAGCPTGLIDLDANHDSRVALGISELLAGNYVTTLSDWQGGRPLSVPSVPLVEAERSARLILELWF